MIYIFEQNLKQGLGGYRMFCGLLL